MARLRHGLSFAVAIAASQVCLAVPPPPPPPGAPDFATILRDGYHGPTDRRFIDAFKPDVSVMEDGKLVGSNRDGYLSRLEGERAHGFRRRVLSIAYGGDQILLMEQVTTIPKTVNTDRIYDCCTFARATLYTYDGSYRISSVETLVTDRAANATVNPDAEFP